MKYVLLPLLVAFNVNAAFTEFYVNDGGGATNSGFTAGPTPIFARQNGNWTSATGVFVCIGAPTNDLSGLTNGMWASVYTDGATATGFIGRISNVDDATDTITMSPTVYKSGTAPTTSATLRSIAIGGAWPFPSGSVAGDFPFGFLEASAIDTLSNVTRLNIKSNIYTATGSLTFGGSFGARVQGYTTTPGDGGKPIINTTTGSSFVIIDVNGTLDMFDFEIDANFTAGTSPNVQSANSRLRMYRVVSHDSRAQGFNPGTSTASFTECESYNNLSHGFACSSPFAAVNCVAHHNQQAGFKVDDSAVIINCIAYSNSATGFHLNTATDNANVNGCDAFANGDGFLLAGVSEGRYRIINCNVFANGTNGFKWNASQYMNGEILSCGFGTGTMTNYQGNFNDVATNRTEIRGSVFYPADVTPWVNPRIGNFTLFRPYAKVGYGNFLQYTNSIQTTSYPTIGSQQYPVTNILGGNAVWAQ